MMRCALFYIRIMSERLKQLRMSHDLTQNEAADKIGISRSTYSSWELGASEPNALEMIQICNTFSVSSEYFYGHIDDYVTVTIPREFDIDLNRYTSSGLKNISEYCKFIASKSEYVKY